jgi:hypothetical protein
MTTNEQQLPVHTALRAAVGGGNFTSILRLLSVKLFVRMEVEPPQRFIDAAGFKWILNSSEANGDKTLWNCVYERI